ncbi:L-2-hydroxyglutarate oxidase [Saccharopolyspora dendranthemae]|uniref:Malate dehydrogenase (Quinone)/L-2-hydroxyglutarate oxidase n=1 Tax=Saccharopolyspora dendranthemae TaxID=1181886 RepID=A0A561VAH7_9PSEU|nr:L-2-hydroxyglutarate oxidase [Saccharopolyspora dendranthemae]TWG08619.1 malate dehydrogenase (quinone)/L-2-hydroxyglutarate oxidase [Saccharopolyspora dendranthemae]
MTNDVAIIGGGIVGLATAHALSERHPGHRITVLDKERHWGAHQTGHNSGVIHSGLYYAPGSAKSRFARAGGEAMYRFCTDHGIPVRRTGKVVVATSNDQLPRLAELQRRGEANGVQAHELDLIGLREREPHVRGVRALLVPDAGITDFAAVSAKLADLLAERGVDLRPATELLGVRRDGAELVLRTNRGEVRTRRAVNCAGLHSDAVAELAGTTPPARILPFRGEYYETTSFTRDLVNALVYPVPDPAFPFLGVHLTRMIDGSLHVGPNAVPALSREGYRWGAISPRHLQRLVTDPGLRVLAKKHWRAGATEIARSALKPLFLRAARSLLPDLRGHDLLPAEAGVRAQAVAPDGTLVDDFLVVEDENWVHVLNAPSPAATASLLIGKDIANRLDSRG